MSAFRDKADIPNSHAVSVNDPYRTDRGRVVAVRSAREFAKQHGDVLFTLANN